MFLSRFFSMALTHCHLLVELCNWIHCRSLPHKSICSLSWVSGASSKDQQLNVILTNTFMWAFILYFICLAGKIHTLYVHFNFVKVRQNKWSLIVLNTKGLKMYKWKFVWQLLTKGARWYERLRISKHFLWLA